MWSTVLLLVGVVVLAVLSGACGGYYFVRWQGRTRQATPLSPTGYFCEVCHEPAIKHRTHDGRRVCAAHKAPN